MRFLSGRFEVRLLRRFVTSNFALTVAVTARTWGVTPSSLLGVPAGTLAALNVDTSLAGRLAEEQDKQRG